MRKKTIRGRLRNFFFPTRWIGNRFFFHVGLKNINILLKIKSRIDNFHDSHLPLLRFTPRLWHWINIKRLPARSLVILWHSWIASCNWVINIWSMTHSLTSDLKFEKRNSEAAYLKCFPDSTLSRKSKANMQILD